MLALAQQITSRMEKWRSNFANSISILDLIIFNFGCMHVNRSVEKNT